MALQQTKAESVRHIIYMALIATMLETFVCLIAVLLVKGVNIQPPLTFNQSVPVVAI